jgi:hypothetical protein
LRGVLMRNSILGIDCTPAPPRSTTFYPLSTSRHL